MVKSRILSTRLNRVELYNFGIASKFTNLFNEPNSRNHST